MLPKPQIQEELSRAYIYAISSKAGMTFQRPTLDYDSVDVQISAIGKVTTDSTIESPILEIQAKATYAHDFNGNDELSYPLKIKNYNDLRKNTLAERILVVYLMPREESDWVKTTHTNLQLQKCAYWVSLKGFPDTENSDTVTIKIPKANIFNEHSIKTIMINVSKGEEISNVL